MDTGADGRGCGEVTGKVLHRVESAGGRGAFEMHPTPVRGFAMLGGRHSGGCAAVGFPGGACERWLSDMGCDVRRCCYLWAYNGDCL